MDLAYGLVERWRNGGVKKKWRGGKMDVLEKWLGGELGGLTERCGGGEECVSILALKQKQYGEKEQDLKEIFRFLWEEGEAIHTGNTGCKKKKKKEKAEVPFSNLMEMGWGRRVLQILP